MATRSSIKYPLPTQGSMMSGFTSSLVILMPLGPWIQRSVSRARVNSAGFHGQLSHASGHTLAHNAVFLCLTDKGNAVANTEQA